MKVPQIFLKIGQTYVKNSKLFGFFNSDNEVEHTYSHNYILPRYFISKTANSHLFSESVHERQIGSRKGTDKILWTFTEAWLKISIYFFFFTNKFKIQILSNNGLESSLRLTCKGKVVHRNIEGIWCIYPSASCNLAELNLHAL